MIDAVMPKLSYISPPEYRSYSSYREYLRESANFTCAYCTITESESPGATFNIEHFKPQKYFPRLAAKCENLRYSCPRCNSYKGDLWISEADGCDRNCEECKHHVCKDNIDRFINPMQEEPSKIITLGEDDKLYAYNSSKPANYTIQYLRLNRAQLIKLRHVRRFMDSWLKDLEYKRQKATGFFESMQKKQRDFSAQMDSKICKKENIYQDAIATMYEMMVLQAEQSVLLIDGEIRKLNYLTAQRVGCDELISSHGENTL